MRDQPDQVSREDVQRAIRGYLRLQARIERVLDKLKSKVILELVEGMNGRIASVHEARQAMRFARLGPSFQTVHVAEDVAWPLTAVADGRNETVHSPRELGETLEFWGDTANNEHGRVEWAVRDAAGREVVGLVDFLDLLFVAFPRKEPHPPSRQKLIDLADEMIEQIEEFRAQHGK